LLPFTLHRHEPHAGALRRFANRLGIVRVVLLPLHKRLYIGGRDQPNLMAKLGELTGPVMRSTACLQRYRATRLRCEETKQLSPADPLAKYRSTPLIRSVNVKDVLGDIQTDYDSL
jgi:hypothetical protein